MEPYRTLRRPHEHIQKGIFVAEGEKVVRRLLNSRLSVVSFLLTHEWHEKLAASEDRFRECEAEVFIADKNLLQQIVGYRLHQGIMAVGKVPIEPALSELLAKLRHPFLIVALDSLMNSENVGIGVRNCVGFGVDALLVGETSSSPYLRRAVRNSMGTVFQLPVIHVNDLVTSLQEVRRVGATVLAADPHGDVPIDKMDVNRNTCIVFGNEEAGISPRVLEACDQRVAIPMHDNTDSLNVSSASAVFLYEVERLRGRGKN